MDAVVTEWLSLIIRWLHVVAGIAWIGSSFYFIHLDLSLKPRPGLPAGVKGDAWQVHGGGFYHMVKFMVAPARMPDELTWFKWEAYTTWLSGFALLVIVYYLGAELYLIDKSVLNLSAPMAALIAFGSLLSPGCSTRACAGRRSAKHEIAMSLVGYAFLVGAHLCLHPRVQRPRRLHPDRRAHRHHHGGERLRHHHSLPEEDRSGAASPARSPTRNGARKASGDRSTTTISRCRSSS